MSMTFSIIENLAKRDAIHNICVVPADEVQRTVTILVTGWQQDAASIFDFTAALLPLVAFGLAMTLPATSMIRCKML